MPARASKKLKKEFLNLVHFNFFCSSDQKILKRIADSLATILAYDYKTRAPELFSSLISIISAASEQALKLYPNPLETLFLKAGNNEAKSICNYWYYYGKEHGVYVYRTFTHDLNIFQVEFKDLLKIVKSVEKEAVSEYTSINGEIMPSYAFEDSIDYKMRHNGPIFTDFYDLYYGSHQE